MTFCEMRCTDAHSKGGADTWKLGLWVIWDDRCDHKDPDWFSVVELAGHIMMSFGDQHGGRCSGTILLAVRQCIFGEIQTCPT